MSREKNGSVLNNNGRSPFVHSLRQIEINGNCDRLFPGQADYFFAHLPRRLTRFVFRQDSAEQFWDLDKLTLFTRACREIRYLEYVYKSRRYGDPDFVSEKDAFP